MKPADALLVRLRLQRGDFELEVDLSVPGRGVTSLFGPSGSGKTTLLRCLAGLDHAPGGEVVLRGEVWQDATGCFVPTHRRRLGYVSQAADLFPHLSVAGNLDFGWRRTEASRRQISRDEVIGWFGLSGLLDRRPAGLAGGEIKRVAIARAVLTSPTLLLMDEPLAALDEASRQAIMPYLEQLRSRLDIPVIYVTHRLEEVMRLAEHMVFIEAGRERGSGPLNQLLARTDLFAAYRDRVGVVLPASVAAHDDSYGLTTLTTELGELSVAMLAEPVGHRVRVEVLSRDVSLALNRGTAGSILNEVAVVVRGIHVLDAAQVLVELATAVDREVPALLARITRKSCDRLELVPGSAVFARVKSVSLR